MPSSDAERWDARYSNGEPPAALRPPELVEIALETLPLEARVLDVACGWGDAGLWLASRGAAVTLADVSVVALSAAAERAQTLGVEVETITTDLATEPVPTGPWDAITCVHYLDRELLPRLAAELSPTGKLVIAIATTINLERHSRPSARFLLEPDELATLIPGHVAVHHDEAWRTNDAHEAWAVFVGDQTLVPSAF